MFQKNREVPPCGHVDRRRELTIIEFVNTRGNLIEFKICTVPTCREYCRVYCDMRDDWPEGGPDHTQKALSPTPREAM